MGCRKIRVLGKIRAFTDLELESSKGVSTTPWISVHKPKGELSESVKISFGDQTTSRREMYEVDYCYEQHEDNSLIYSREIKPLTAGVFDSRNVSVIAFGARGSGKTCTIQGSEEQPGLAVLAMADILTMANETGKSVSFSYYEVYQDQVYDLLDPKRPLVMLLENAQGKIQLKGLSKVAVKSFSEFQKLYVNGCDSHKAKQKIAFELPHRSHKGLMVHVSSCGENTNFRSVGKMNFVDLAGYEDARRKSSDGSTFSENTKINKSMYALQNVVYALNAKESHVPYRESKLTRMLQDSLGGTSQILMVTCLNPSFCQDTIYMVSLASKAYLGINRGSMDSTKKCKSTADSTKKCKSIAKVMVPSSSKISKPSMKKQTNSSLPLSEKKPNGASLGVKGRKLFDEENRMKTSEQENSLPSYASATVGTEREEEKSASDVPKETISVEEDLVELKDTEPTALTEKVISMCTWENYSEISPNNGTKALTFFFEGQKTDKENETSLLNEDGSPPISTRLRELSNNLKSLYSSTPLCIKMPEENDTLLYYQRSADITEPRTPTAEESLRVNDKWEVTNITSPREIFNAQSTGIKKSLVQECLAFLNSASKEELKGLKGIGEKRATYILQLREESPKYFKNLDSLKDVGLSARQIKGMMQKVAGDLFS